MEIRKLRHLGVVFSALALVALLIVPVVAGINVKKEIKADYDNEIVAAAKSSGAYAWGLKRGKNGALPEADPSAVRLLNEYGGIYLGNTEQKKIYLTFDEGYENGYTAKILDVLKENNVKAVFFITGDYFERESELVKRMIVEGHEVGNHTMNHPTLTELDADDIKKEVMLLSDALREKYGYTTRMVRPPKGEFDEKTLSVCCDVAHTNIMWSFAYKDWIATDVKGAGYATDMVLSNLHNGAVILLHAVSPDNADALDGIIKGAIAKGYSFGTPDELLTSNAKG